MGFALEPDGSTGMHKSLQLPQLPRFDGSFHDVQRRMSLSWTEAVEGRTKARGIVYATDVADLRSR